MSNLIGKSINCNLYTVSNDTNDTDSSHITSIVAVNTVDNSRKHDKEEILNKLEKKWIQHAPSHHRIQCRMDAARNWLGTSEVY